VAGANVVVIIDAGPRSGEIAGSLLGRLNADKNKWQMSIPPTEPFQGGGGLVCTASWQDVGVKIKVWDTGGQSYGQEACASLRKWTPSPSA
jgi:hypothetical protein